MRTVILLSVASALAACAAVPPQPYQPSPRAQQRLAGLLAGKVAGPPVACLPSYRSHDMIAIDENTVAFRVNSRQVYVNHLRGSCSRLGSPRYALVTRQFGDPRLCRGDIAEVADVQAGISVGNCALGDFVPYTRR